jgi:uncharacterized membrane protein
LPDPTPGLLPRRPDQFRPTAVQMALVIVAVAFVLGYTFLIDRAVAAYGVRASAAGMLGIGLLSWAKTGFARPAGAGRAVALVAVLPLLLLGAAVTGDHLWMLLTPAGVQLVVAGAFVVSLGSEETIVEKVAAVMDPNLPDFARPYCRKMTLGLCLLFVVNAVAIATLAVTGPEHWWRAYAHWGSYGALAAFLSVEFFVRKIWFRNYVDTPLDRALARLFPAENTPRGRRSQDYIRRRREELARAGAGGE